MTGWLFLIVSIGVIALMAVCGEASPGDLSDLREAGA